jgi:LemA protein
MVRRISWSGITCNVQLKQCHDLVPNLVEIVKGYAAHERQTLENVTKAHDTALSAQGPAAQAFAEGQLQGARPSNPDLKASQNLQQLQNERFFNITGRIQCHA